MNKSAGTEALMRVTGSLAFVAAARAAYLVARDKGDGARRLFLPMKNNIGPDSTGLAFRIEGATVQSSAGPLQTSRVAWEAAPVTITADEAMRTETPEQGSALREAEEWLRDALSEPTPAAEVIRMAKAAGISDRTLRRARKSLGIQPNKDGYQGPRYGRCLQRWPNTPKMAKKIVWPPLDNLATFGSTAG